MVNLSRSVGSAAGALLLWMIMPVLPLAAAVPARSDVDAETLQHFQAMLQVDTANPPGNETVLAEQLAQILRDEGIEVQLLSRDPARANLVARLRGNGSKRPFEEGGVQFGIEFMVNEHFAEIDAEYCLAEGGSVVRQGGAPLYAGLQAGEKKRRTAVLTASGVAGHGSVPLRNNAVVRLSRRLPGWQSGRPHTPERHDHRDARQTGPGNTTCGRSALPGLAEPRFVGGCCYGVVARQRFQRLSRHHGQHHRR